MVFRIDDAEKSQYEYKSNYGIPQDPILNASPPPYSSWNDGKLVQPNQHDQHEREDEETLVEEAELHQQLYQRRQQNKLFVIKAKIAARKIQHAWKLYKHKRQQQQRQVDDVIRDRAARIVTRAMQNYTPIVTAKRIAQSLRRLDVIRDQVEAVDASKAVRGRAGKGVSLFENEIDRLIAKVDAIDSWGSTLVRKARKQVVLRANERITNETIYPPQLPTTPKSSPTPTTTPSTQPQKSEIEPNELVQEDAVEVTKNVFDSTTRTTIPTAPNSTPSVDSEPPCTTSILSATPVDSPTIPLPPTTPPPTSTLASPMTTKESTPSTLPPTSTFDTTSFSPPPSTSSSSPSMPSSTTTTPTADLTERFTALTQELTAEVVALQTQARLCTDDQQSTSQTELRHLIANLERAVASLRLPRDV